MAAKTKEQKQPRVLQPAPSGDDREDAEKPAAAAMATEAEALARILGPWRGPNHEAIRHAVLGDSGTGKSVHMRWLLGALMREGCADLAFVLDDKDPEPSFHSGQPELEGLAVEHRIDLDDATVNPPDAPIISFRGDWRTGRRCEPEELAARQLAHARDEQPHRLRTVLVLDELKRATNAQDDGDGKKWTAPSCKIVATEGRNMGASLIYGNQSPQEIPRSGLNNASTLAFHRLGPNAANYIGGTLLFPDEMVEAIRVLQMFEYVLWVPGVTSWDGRIYTVPHPKNWER